MLTPKSIAAAAALALAALPLHAEEAVRPAGVTFGSAVQVVLGLALVLAMVGAAAWLVKRVGATPTGGNGLVRVLGGAAVGQRERVVLVEVHGHWLVLGVAPGQVSALLNLAKPDDAPAPGGPTAASAPFAQWFRQTLERRHHG